MNHSHIPTSGERAVTPASPIDDDGLLPVATPTRAGGMFDGVPVEEMKNIASSLGKKNNSSRSVFTSSSNVDKSGSSSSISSLSQSAAQSQIIGLKRTHDDLSHSSSSSSSTLFSNSSSPSSNSEEDDNDRILRSWTNPTPSPTPDSIKEQEQQRQQEALDQLEAALNQAASVLENSEPIEDDAEIFLDARSQTYRRLTQEEENIYQDFPNLIQGALAQCDTATASLRAAKENFNAAFSSSDKVHFPEQKTAFEKEHAVTNRAIKETRALLENLKKKFDRINEEGISDKEEDDAMSEGSIE